MQCGEFIAVSNKAYLKMSRQRQIALLLVLRYKEIIPFGFCLMMSCNVSNRTFEAACLKLEYF